MRMRPKPNSTPDDLAFGINAVAAALRQGLARSILYLEDSTNPRVSRVVEQAGVDGVPTTAVDLARLNQLTGSAVHQGLVVRLRDLPTIDLKSLANLGEKPSIAVLLDGITDPQNLGAVLRTSVALGVEAVVTPRRRGASLTPGVHRASAGLSFVAPVATPQNLAAAVRQLKQLGYWIVAADGEGAVDATSFDWPNKTALILGNEEKGVSRLLLDEADFTVALPMDGAAESLNVGVAFGALGYLWRRQWPQQEITKDGATSTS